MKLILLLSAAVALPAIAQADERPMKDMSGAAKRDMAPAKPASKEFELVRGLVGTWKGAADMAGKKEDTTTSFRLTAAGSAVVETMDAGTPHEMTNVYHDVDGQLMMTHYCAVGNAPQMRVAASDGKSISFEAIKANGIDPKTTPHMHGLVYVWNDKDHLSATWTSMNMGKEHEAPAVFSYARVVAEKADR